MNETLIPFCKVIYKQLCGSNPDSFCTYIIVLMFFSHISIPSLVFETSLGHVPFSEKAI